MNAFVRLDEKAPTVRGAPVLEGTALSKPADYNLTLYDLEGRAVPFAQYRGKTVFLNVWATWCGPCVMEMPSIARFFALCISQAPGFSGMPESGHCRRAASNASWASSSAWPTSRVRRVRPPISFAASIRQTASIAR